MEAGLVVNPVAGGRAFRSIDRLEELLMKEVALKTLVTRNRGDAESFARELAGRDTIIVAGGDGTINEVINGLLLSDNTEASNKSSLAIIPLGTANVLANELSIPERIEDAVHLALTGVARKISLGRINGRYFSLMAGIGFDGETVLNVRSSIKRLSGKGAYILSGILNLLRYNPSIINVKTDRTNISGTTAVIGNTHFYAGRFHVTSKASISEPSLDLCLFMGKRRKDMLKYVFGVITERHLKYNDVYYEKCSQLEISSAGTVHIQVDGDYFGTLPVKIDIVPDALNIIC